MAAHLLAQERTAARHFWYRLRARAVSKFVPRGATLVDVGAGAGSLGAIFETTRTDVAYRYLEPNAELAGHLRARFGESRAHVAGTKLAAPSCAVLLDVIEHVPDDVSLLCDAAKDLPPGSRVIVTVPAFGFLWSEWDVKLGHHRRYTRQELGAAMTAAGLRVIQLTYLFPELVPAALLRRVIGGGSTEDFPKLPRPLNALLFVVGRATQALGRAVPFGTSVFAVGVVPDEDAHD